MVPDRRPPVYNSLISIPEKISYVPEPAVISRITDLTETEKLFLLKKVNGNLAFSAGQFVQVSVPGYGEAPFSVCSSPLDTDSFEICVRSVGHVSDALHSLSPGDGLGIRGPYGRGFPVEKMKYNDLLVVAGGIGLAPLRSLISYACVHRKYFGRLIVVYGAKTPSSLLFREDLARWESDIGMRVYQIVDEPDNAWKGPTGVLTDPLKEIRIDPQRTVAAVVGPPVVFRFVAMELFNKNLQEDRIYFSLERRFQCGVGKCGHCQLNDMYVCQNGPVFSYAELVGRSEAAEARAPEDE